jgi:hypothetical protein
MSDMKSLELLRALLRQTVAGQVAWKAADEKGTEFHAELGDYGLHLRTRFDRDYPDSPDYFLTIIDSHGREVEVISNISLRPLSDEKDADGRTPYATFSELYDAARRLALGVDDAIDSLLKKLG